MGSISENTNLWQNCLKKLKEKFDSNIYDNFFSETYIYDIKEDNTIVLCAKGSSAAILLANKYEGLILETLKEISGVDYKLDVYEYDDIIKYGKNTISEAVNNNSFFKNASLNNNFTFDNFVSGDFNREASQASLMTASNIGMFNPLFIYSDSGLGKTHLLHAIGNYIKHNKPNSKILCLTADDFISEYIKSAKGEKNLDEFRNYCNDCDALLIDDIQFMKSSEKCQECFYLIFNELDKANKQIVITSDRNPNELNGIQDRLVTRFGKGLTVTIKKPDKETSLAILKKKIQAPNLSHITWDELALVYVAEKFNKTVRDLEGALNKIVLQTVINNDTHVTIQLVADALSNQAGIGSIKEEITEQKIINIVADYYKLEPYLLTGTSHTKNIVLARHIAMYLIRTELDTQFKKIGEAFGGKDHSSVMSAIAKVEKLLKIDEATKEAISILKNKIRNE